MPPPLFTRLTAPLIGVSALLLGLAVGAAWYIDDLHDATSRSLEDHLSSMRAAEKFETGVRDIRARIGDFLYEPGNQSHLDELPTLKEQTEYWLMEAVRAAKTLEEKRLMRRVKEGYEAFFKEYRDLIRKYPPRSDLKAYFKIGDLIDKSLDEKILAPARQYVELNWRMLSEYREASRAAADRLYSGLIIVGVCGAAAGLLAGAVIAWNFRRSMIQLQVRLRDTADQLNELVGPVTLTGGSHGLRGLDADLQQLAVPVREVIEKLHESRAEANRAEQLAWVGQIAAGIAHEVRNPLTTIKILIQAAAERGDDSRLGPDAAILLEEIGRLERLVGSFLEFARPPAIARRPFAVDDLLNQAVTLVTPRAEAGGVTLVSESPRRPLWVEGDFGQVHQVLFNLLINALHESPAGGKVTAWARRGRGRRRRGEFVVIGVEDDGPGLPASLGERIFEPFVSTKESGTGLGLSICRRIVEQHGGKIAAADRPDGGAVFTVTLPLTAAGSAAHAA